MKQKQNIPTHDTYIFANPDIPFDIFQFETDRGWSDKAINDPHLHDCYIMHYIAEGEGTYVIDFQPYEMKPRNLFFLSPGQIHFWHSRQFVSGYVCAFKKEFLDFPYSSLDNTYDLKFLHSLVLAPTLQVEEHLTETLIDIFGHIIREFKLELSNYASVLRAYFHILIVTIQRWYNQINTTSLSITEPSLVRHFKQLVSEQFKKKQSISAYAEQLNVSLSTLNNTIKQTTNSTPSQILHEEIIMEVKRLLANSEMTVSEIGYQLNFEDPSYFGRFFRRQTGISPVAFRKEIREKYQIFKK